jgi:hypothetical protein
MNELHCVGIWDKIKIMSFPPKKGVQNIKGSEIQLQETTIILKSQGFLFIFPFVFYLKSLQH